MSADPSPGSARSPWLVVAAAVVIVSAVVALNGWVCDDAFISLRTAAQFWAGEGLVFNQGWRVQAYTHPAWMVLILIAHGLTGGGFWTLLGLGLVVSAVGIAVATRHLPDAQAVVIVVAALIGSRAFVEYSTSGLENPATHLVVILGFVLALAGGLATLRLRFVGLALAFAYLCRPDALLLVLPLVVVVAREARGAGARGLELLVALAPGLGLFAAWELFSLVYYGALVPNTALAKLGVGIGRVELAGRGLDYVLRPLTTDPVTAALVVAGVALPWLAADEGELARLRPLALGSALYLVYVVAIGGDFMAGRFLTAPVLIGALALAMHRSAPWQASWAWALGLGAALVALASLGARHTLVPDRGEAKPRMDDGIADERSFYAEHASALSGLDGRAMPSHPWRARAEAHDPAKAPVVQFNTMGYFGYFVAPEVHVVDGFALADPLLARVPPVRRIDWKAGHHARILPDDYLAGLAAEANTLRDPALAALYDDLLLVHTAPLFAPGRWAAIARLHRGTWREGFDPQRYALAELVVERTPRTRAWLREPKRFRDAGIELRLGEPRVIDKLELELSLGQTYAFEWRRAGEIVAREVAELPGELDDLGFVELVPERPTETHDALRVVPLTMHGKRTLALRRVRVFPARP